MSKLSSKPTLLVFTLGASREQRRRRLLPSALGSQERALHQEILDSALRAGRESGCRLMVSCPEAPELPADATLIEQARGTFGERLTQALSAAFAAGTGPVLLVGSDVPGLTAGHLRQALAALKADPAAVVVGPSPDGGFYLMGCHRGPEEILREIPWCRRHTRRVLLRELHRTGRETTLLEPLLDLDEQGDLLRWLSAPFQDHWRAFARRLVALLAQLLGPFTDFAPTPTLGRPLPVRAGRAPPRRR